MVRSMYLTGRPLINYMGADASDIGAAAGTAIAPGIGTAIGSALGHAMSSIDPNWDGSHPKEWANAGPGVHDWFTQNGEQEFLDWMRSNHPTQFDSLDHVKAMRYAWAFGKDHGDLNNTQNPTYQLSSGQLMNAAMAALGVDYTATLTKAVADGQNVNNIPARDVVMLPFGGTPQLPAPAANIIGNAAAAVQNGTATAQQQALVNQALTPPPPAKSSIKPETIGLGLIAAKLLHFI